ncbi:hypothetical protein HanHA89_Chr10g0398961 [Helianthus annuus]|nr:hypothetical protein HanHA89_Chr10g0398961 [Helianthus annuus]
METCDSIRSNDTTILTTINPHGLFPRKSADKARTPPCLSPICFVSLSKVMSANITQITQITQIAMAISDENIEAMRWLREALRRRAMSDVRYSSSDSRFVILNKRYTVAVRDRAIYA